MSKYANMSFLKNGQRSTHLVCLEVPMLISKAQAFLFLHSNTENFKRNLPAPHKFRQSFGVQVNII